MIWPAVALLGVSLGGCVDVKAHEVELTITCGDVVREAVVQFPSGDFNFDCPDLDTDCGFSSIRGVVTSGDFVENAIIRGTGRHHVHRYEFLVQPTTGPIPIEGRPYIYDRLVWCGIDYETAVAPDRCYGAEDDCTASLVRR